MINGVLLYKRTDNGLSISGNVYNDINGNIDNLVNNSLPLTIGKDAIPTGLKILLIDSLTQLILQTVNVLSVDDYGTFIFNNVLPNTDYELRLTTASLSIGAAAPVSSALPTYWEITGEAEANTSFVPDGVNDGLTYATTVNSNINNIAFGIRITPSVTRLSVFSPWDGIPPTNAAAMVNLYNNVGSSSTKQMDDIDGLFIDSPLYVNYPLIAVTMSHSRMGSFFQEVGVIINVTSQATIRTSIENWIFANNFYSFSYNGVSGPEVERMMIEDYTNRTYISISIQQP
jgi:hypothetical protein